MCELSNELYIKFIDYFERGNNADSLYYIVYKGI